MRRHVGKSDMLGDMPDGRSVRTRFPRRVGLGSQLAKGRGRERFHRGGKVDQTNVSVNAQRQVHVTVTRQKLSCARVDTPAGQAADELVSGRVKIEDAAGGVLVGEAVGSLAP